MPQTAIFSEIYHMWPVTHECVCEPRSSCNSTETTQIPWSSEENNLDLKFIFELFRALKMW